MGRYQNGQPMGPNVKRLMIEMIATEAVPAGGGLGAALDYLTTPGRMEAVNRRAVQKVEQALDAVKAAPDNPFGNDDEAIAAGILGRIDARRLGL